MPPVTTRVKFFGFFLDTTVADNGRLPMAIVEDGDVRYLSFSRDDLYEMREALSSIVGLDEAEGQPASTATAPTPKKAASRKPAPKSARRASMAAPTVKASKGSRPKKAAAARKAAASL
jgi:hypothetical protein